MRRGGVACATFVLLVLVALPAVRTAAPWEVVVNLKTAANRGCSDDPTGFLVFDGPDLQARVWYGNDIVYTSAHARDTGAPDWFELARFAVDALPATIHLEVREAEPGPTREAPLWVTCDIDPGAGMMRAVTIPVQGATEIDSTGDSAGSARLHARAASALQPHPAPLELSATPTPTCLHLAWTPPPDDPAGVDQYLILDGQWLHMDAGAKSHSWCGLAERTTHTARLRRSFESWSVWAPPRSFTTSNGPPPSPTVEIQGGLDEFNLTWRVDARDVREVVVHCSPTAPFDASGSTRCASGPASASVSVAANPGIVHVRLIATDLGGLTSEVNASTQVRQRPPPPAPEILSIASLHMGARFEWNEPRTAGVAEHLVRAWSEAGVLVATARVPMPLRNATLESLPAGNYTLELLAVGRNGLASAPAVAAFAHAPPNDPPRLDVQMDRPEVRQGASLTLVVSATDPDGDAVEVTVDWGDGTTGNALTHAFSEPGERTITVIAEDTFDARTVVLLRASVVANAAPDVELAVSPPTARVREAVYARPEVHDAEGDAVVAVIDWGDGTPREAISPAMRHAYSRGGSYEVRLIAEDALGAVGFASARVVVEEPAPIAPTEESMPTLTSPTSPAAAGSEPQRAGEASGDPSMVTAPTATPSVQPSARGPPGAAPTPFATAPDPDAGPSATATPWILAVAGALIAAATMRKRLARP